MDDLGVSRRAIAAAIARLMVALQPARAFPYRAANARLLASGDRRPRIVLIGDSIFSRWRDVDRLAPPGCAVINRGVGGQTLAQIRARFAEDVVALSPRAAVILAGGNDLRAVMRPQALVRQTALAEAARDVPAMVEMAHRAGVAVAIANVPPVSTVVPGAGPGARGRDPATIGAFNAWLRAYAAGAHLAFIDVHAALVDPAGRLDARYTQDGVHPNGQGYAVMATLMAPALRRLAQVG